MIREYGQERHRTEIILKECRIVIKVKKTHADNLKVDRLVKILRRNGSHDVADVGNGVGYGLLLGRHNQATKISVNDPGSKPLEFGNQLEQSFQMW